MQIDWFTFTAQIVNFLIVLVLLRRFLFGPITRAMAEREASIAQRFAEAERQSEHARHEGRLFREQRHELEAERNRLLAEAKSEAAEARKTLMHEARAEVEASKERWFAAVEYQRQEILRDLRVRVGERVVQIARGALYDLARADLEQLIIAMFLDQLGELKLSESEYEELPHSPVYNTVEKTITIRTTFVLPEHEREKIVSALQAHFATSRATRYDTPLLRGQLPNVKFEVAEELICGIELQFHNHRVTWNVRDYLGELEDVLDRAFPADDPVRNKLSEETLSQNQVAAFDAI